MTGGVAGKAQALAAAISHPGDVLVNLSGGKDSTATWMHLEQSGFLQAKREQGWRVVFAFADTGWELPETYAYLEKLEKLVGKIHRVATWVPGEGEAPPSGYDLLVPQWATAGKCLPADRAALARRLEARLGRPYSPLVRLMVAWANVPTTQRRWCTEDTKMKPLVGLLATLNNPINVIGVRAGESADRAAQPVWEWSEAHDAFVWRPIHDWTVEQVIELHRASGVDPNPLYLQGSGSGRVGCAPCVYASKADLRWLVQHQRLRLEILGEIEEEIGKLNGRSPRWFSLRKVVEDSDGARVAAVPVPVSQAAEWAQTQRGGRQLGLFLPEEAPGCVAWGMCQR
mgnify:FL=1